MSLKLTSRNLKLGKNIKINLYGHIIILKYKNSPSVQNQVKTASIKGWTHNSYLKNSF